MLHKSAEGVHRLFPGVGNEFFDQLTEFLAKPGGVWVSSFDARMALLSPPISRFPFNSLEHKKHRAGSFQGIWCARRAEHEYLSCGTAVDEAARFCSKCGHSLRSESTARGGTRNSGQSPIGSTISLRSLQQQGAVTWHSAVTKMFDDYTLDDINALMEVPLKYRGPMARVLVMPGTLASIQPEVTVVFFIEQKDNAVGCIEIKKHGRIWTATDFQPY
jgi:hypothetical protein